MAHTDAIVSRFYGLLAKPYGTLHESTGSAVAFAHDASPFISVYRWVDQVGFGTKFSDPATLPTGVGRGVKFTPSADNIIVAHNNAPRMSAYPWNRVTGFGTKYADPASLMGAHATSTAVSEQFLPADYHVAFSAEAAPNVHAYPLSKSGAGWGTKYADPAVLPPFLGNTVAFTPNGNNVAVGTFSAPIINAYAWTDGAGFGAKWADPAVAAGPFNGNGVKWAPNGNSIALAHDQSAGNWLSAWIWSNLTGFGTKYADPSYVAGMSPSIGRSVAFTPGSDIVMLGHVNNINAVGIYSAWAWTDAGGFGARFDSTGAFPGLLAAAQGLSVTFNESKTSFFGGDALTPFMHASRWTNAGGFGTAYADPASLLPDAAFGVDVAR